MGQSCEDRSTMMKNVTESLHSGILWQKYRHSHFLLSSYIFKHISDYVGKLLLMDFLGHPWTDLTPLVSTFPLIRSGKPLDNSLLLFFLPLPNLSSVFFNVNRDYCCGGRSWTGVVGAKWVEQLCFSLARDLSQEFIWDLGLPQGEVSMGPSQVLTQHLAPFVLALWASNGRWGELE